MLQRPAQTASLDLHDRIRLRIEGGIAFEDAERDGVGLQPIASAAERLVDDETEEALQPIRVREVARLADAGDLLPHHVRTRRLAEGNCKSGCDLVDEHGPDLASGTTCYLREG